MEISQQLQKIKLTIENKLKENKQIIIGIDGRCGGGKSTFANYLKVEYPDIKIIQMDNYFLRPNQKTIKRLEEIGGNIDYERFIKEIITPIKNQEQKIVYSAYNCKTQTLSNPKEITIGQITIIEGTYSLHPLYQEIYDIKIYVDIDQATQLQRIENRNGTKILKQFQEKWIPLEEKYFFHMNIPQSCDFIIK